MDTKTLKMLVEAGAVKRIHIIADGALFHVNAETAGGTHTASTVKGTPKTWVALDTTAKWVRSLGIGTVQLDLTRWQPGQRGLRI